MEMIKGGRVGAFRKFRDLMRVMTGFNKVSTSGIKDRTRLADDFVKWAGKKHNEFGLNPPRGFALKPDYARLFTDTCP